MSKTFLNKVSTITVSLLLAMSMLLTGCSGGDKGKATAPDANKKPAAQVTEQAAPKNPEKKAAEIDKKMSGARNTPIVEAAKKVNLLRMRQRGHSRNLGR